ncbi:MAG: hypothetical protein IANPNBLG_00938 [Bryobacteraceae bacterium]|nr:hypothetical protein [Bryobacteraceae bacterium]
MENGFTSREMRTLRTLKTPARIQQFLDCEIGYNKEEDGPTCRSPRLVLKDRRAHCVEGALLAAAALRVHGHPPMLLDLEAVRDDDHVLAVYKDRGHWGAIGKSNYASLRFREPVYRTVRELVMSYFEHYHNVAGEKTLRRYSRPVSLTRFDHLHWMTSTDDVWAIPEYLCTVSHFPVITRQMERHLNPLDSRLRAAEKVGMRK